MYNLTPSVMVIGGGAFGRCDGMINNKYIFWSLSVVPGLQLPKRLEFPEQWEHPLNTKVIVKLQVLFSAITYKVYLLAVAA